MPTNILGEVGPSDPSRAVSQEAEAVQMGQEKHQGDDTYHVGVDIGGTFTDCVVTDGDGRIVVSTKSPSTPEEPSQGVIDVLKVAAVSLSIPVEDLVNGTKVFVHGGTIATNAVVERKGPRTALITSRGHEDTLTVGRICQKVAGLTPDEIIDEYQLRKAEPPLVPRNRIVGVNERVDCEGEIVVPLDQEDARQLIQSLLDGGAESLAVCLLWSPVQPRHEVRIRELVRQMNPGMYVAISSDVAPIIGEYERTATTVLTAFLGPNIEDYLTELARRLEELGFRHELLLVQSTGGLTPPEGLKGSPLFFLDSGPVAGVLGGRYVSNLYQEPNMILMDMGGTSFDVGVLHNGQLQIDEAPVIQKYSYLVPKVDVRSIGSGGGSKIWVDAKGFLRVGPQSAGAHPGPACYDQGGHDATVTDADLVLGLLNGEYFLGGRKHLNYEKSIAAMQSVGEVLNMGTLDVAAGAFRIVNAQMADLIRANTIERGYDPRNFALLAYGGAGPTHAAFLARDLKMQRVYVPRNAAVFCGLGMLTTDLLHTYQMSCPLRFPSSEEGIDRLNRTFQQLEARVYQQFSREGIVREHVEITRLAYMKYTLQVHEITVMVLPGTVRVEDQELLVQNFEKAYESIYGQGTGYRKAGIELTRCRVEGRCKVPTPDLESAETSAVTPVSSLPLKGHRDVYMLDGQEAIETRPVSIYDGEQLHAGQTVPGPCIIERMADTVVIPAWARASVDRFMGICIQIHLA